MYALLERINAAVWGIPLLILILGVGIYISIRTGFVQFRSFPKALKAFLRQFKKNVDTEGVSSYRALCTALAATVGTGNLAGVAGAIAIGGPGAIFWMWICALIGMTTKFAEATLAVRYRQRTNHGEFVGGPMYMIRNGLKKKWHVLAYIYCFLGVVASFGVGNATQINTVIGGAQGIADAFGTEFSLVAKILLGSILAVLLTVLLLGGAKRIGSATEVLVPVVSAGYLLLGATVLIMRADAIPGAFEAIFTGAFNPKAVTGGVVGSVFATLRIGASRGVFTNEAGMGTASIAHAAGNVRHPTEQGLMGIMEVFIDTIVICTVTALVILCSGVPITYGIDTGVTLTAEAFSAVSGDWICIPLTFALCCFAIATVLGWGLYGARCAQFLFGDDAWKKFVLLQGVMVIVGAVLNTGTVWLLADIVNGLMAIPNLIALLLLTPELVRLTKKNA
ncbi:MAG: sodium:alanine symporter family protein [Oscillospiraceae bacterium]|nr:sodium:alanine symporter family protein [Oscillospiraceae bacterium]